MFDQLFRGWTPIIILVVVVLLFGASRLPALARSLGQSRNAIRSEFSKGDQEPGDVESTTHSEPPAATNTKPDASD